MIFAKPYTDAELRAMIAVAEAEQYKVQPDEVVVAIRLLATIQALKA